MARPQPGFSSRIIRVGGIEGAKLEAIQTRAIREVLEWLQDHPPTTG